MELTFAPPSFSPGALDGKGMIMHKHNWQKAKMNW